jgi:hypothetical protein
MSLREVPAVDPYDMSHGFAWIVDEARAIILAEGMPIQDVRWGLDAKPGAVPPDPQLYFDFDKRR